MTINPAGPVFGLSALVNNLGGKLTTGETGESTTLTLAGKEVVIGPGNAIITVGDNIVSLSQPAVAGRGRLQVPVDFLRKTFGDLLGYSFDWRPETQRLTIARRGARELPVIARRRPPPGDDDGGAAVHRASRATRSTRAAGRDPGADARRPPGAAADASRCRTRCVQDVAIAPEQVRIQLAPGLDVASYVLENPFRLVFDVHRASVDGDDGARSLPSRAGRGRAGHPHDRHRSRPRRLGDRGDRTERRAGEGADAAPRARPRGAARAASACAWSSPAARTPRVPLDTRAAIANQNKADLFISIHLNSSLGAGAHGTETYFLSPQASDPRAASSAAAEKRRRGAAEPRRSARAPADDGRAEDLELILWDLAQSHHLSESQRFANLIQGELNETLQLRDRGVKQAPFRVLKRRRRCRPSWWSSASSATRTRRRSSRTPPTAASWPRR